MDTPASHTDYLNLSPPEVHLNSFTPVNEQQVKQVIMKMSSASCVSDPIPTKVVKKCVDILSTPITTIINTSIESGKFPSNWKTAVVIPLIKKSTLPPILSNFRPVSNLQFLSKVAEKVIVNHLTAHMNAHCPLPTVQSAYRNNYSTETLLVKIQTDILKAMDQQRLTLMVLLDLSAAFDTVNHNILLDILQKDFGVVGCAINWFRSYLELRSQLILINTEISDNFELESGVPQGSCLGPLCFTAYSSSLFKVINQHLPEGFGYADDTQLLHTFRPTSSTNQSDATEAIQNCITDIKKWMVAHKLKLNDSKTELMILGTSKQLEKLTTDSIVIGSEVIRSVKKVRNLGVMFDSNLKMTDHVNNICRIGHYHLTNLRKIRHHMTDDTVKVLANAFIHSHMDYCNALLYNINDNSIMRLQRLQNAAARLVHKCTLADRISCVKLLSPLHWLPVRYRIEFKILTLVYKCLNNQAPVYLQEYIIACETSAYNLRSNDLGLLQVPKTNSKTLGDRGFHVSGPTLWNKLPQSIRDSDSLNMFKRQLKTHFFRLAFEKS